YDPMFVDTNHNQWIELGELQCMVQGHAIDELYRSLPRPGGPGMGPPGNRPQPPNLKIMVDNYWQHPESLTNRASAFPRPPGAVPGSGYVPGAGPPGRRADPNEAPKP
ncbi:MAG TPA: hypothetical protein VF988_06635, partial [Verrucomicrobiae bacterium]